MNSYQVMGIIAICTLLFSGVVTLLTMQGVHVLLALLSVYLFAVWSMLCMQRRARDNFDIRDDEKRRHRDAVRTRNSRTRAIDFSTVER